LQFNFETLHDKLNIFYLQVKQHLVLLVLIDFAKQIEFHSLKTFDLYWNLFFFLFRKM